ncbi:MAG: tail fiber domain-containing protein [Sandaracinaceae bacterium]|nr:tail fiber domain-containing protein [Sandaracinaceae bacterium]
MATSISEPRGVVLGVVFFLATISGAAGCGGSHSAEDGGAGSDASTSACPAAAPAAGSACTRDGLVCAFGDDPRPQCRRHFACSGGAWTAQTPATDCDPLPPVTCPASREAAQGTACSPEGAYCSYDGLACACTTCPRPYPLCMPLDAPVWECAAPNADPACPSAIPNAGAACSVPAQHCSYGCEADLDRDCTGGVWVESSSPSGCPISTRRAKHDITYLSETETDALAAETISMRLATYEYNDVALAGRRHLGFILEDAPMSYAAEPERSQIDLYGYTSLLLATTQSQARRIDALEREVRRLQRRGR